MNVVGRSSLVIGQHIIRVVCRLPSVPQKFVLLVNDGLKGTSHDELGL